MALDLEIVEAVYAIGLRRELRLELGTGSDELVFVEDESAAAAAAVGVCLLRLLLV